MSVNHITNLELVKLSADAKADVEASVSTKNTHNTMQGRIHGILIGGAEMESCPPKVGHWGGRDFSHRIYP